MVESNRADLVRTTDPGLEKRAGELQNSLLQFRFENYGKVQLPNTPGAEKLGPRTRDLFLSVAAASSQDSERCRLLLEDFEFQDRMSREPLPLAQHAVLRALFYVIHLYPKGVLQIKDLTAAVNLTLQDHREAFRLQARKVGAALTSLGFWRRERTNQGWTVQLTEKDRRRVHELAKTYGVDQRTLWAPTLNCPICHELGLEEQMYYVSPETRLDFIELVRAYRFIQGDPSSKETCLPTNCNDGGVAQVDRKP